MSIDGRKVLEMPVTLETSVDVSGLPQGVYILRVGSRTEKIIVK